MAEAFNNELQNLAISDSASSAVEAARNLIVQSLSNEIATLKPIVFLDVSASMPALYWANRLYGGAGSDVEGNATTIAGLNAVVDPGFMPTTFEALSP